MQQASPLDFGVPFLEYPTMDELLAMPTAAETQLFPEPNLFQQQATGIEKSQPKADVIVTAETDDWAFNHLFKSAVDRCLHELSHEENRHLSSSSKPQQLLQIKLVIASRASAMVWSQPPFQTTIRAMTLLVALRVAVLRKAQRCSHKKKRKCLSQSV